jgi:3-hydroxyisobutyrate dehydrogenase-like beta-hydroxyacid dehydrogenase
MARANTPSICFIGFGEAGQALAAGLRDAGVNIVAAWDILLPIPDGQRLCEAADQMGAHRVTDRCSAALI